MIILALGMSAPIVAAFNFVDTLAQVGTTVGQVDEILKTDEQLHAETPVSFNGYDTVVGGGGAHLFGGERQRIAIARAMLKDAPVVVLDEATAYIAPENEAVIQRAVAKLVADKTVIVIAHRLSTITGAAKSGGHVFFAYFTRVYPHILPVRAL